MRILLLICWFLVHSLAFAEDLGGVAGQVRGTDGKPAEGVRIAALFAVEEPDGRLVPARTLDNIGLTDRFGRYRVTNITPGRYFLIGGRIDAPSFYPGTKDANDATLVTVTSGSIKEDLNFSLVQHPGWKLSGRITTNGVAMPRKITIFASGAFWFRQDVTVGENGFFTFHGLGPGSYDLSTFADALLWNGSSIVVKQGDVTDVRVVAVPFAQPHGSVEVEGGGPLPSLALELKGKSGKGKSAIYMNLETGVPLMSLPVGEYRIALPDLPKEYRVVSFKYGNTDLLKKPITLDGGVQQFTVKLAAAQPSRLRSIRGRVAGLENLSTEPQVTLSGTSLLMSMQTSIDNDGSFEFSNVAPGTYTLRAGASESREVVVGDADVQGAGLAIPPIRHLMGRVIVASGGPVPRLDITFARDSTNIVYARSRVPGIFDAFIPEGEFRIRVSGFPRDLYEVQSITFGTSDLLKEPVRIAGRNLPEIVVQLGPTTPGFKIAGRFLNRLGGTAALTSPRVILSSRTTQVFATAAPDGSFEFAGVPPDTYEIGSAGFTTTRLTVEDKDLLGIEIPAFSPQTTASTPTAAASETPVGPANEKFVRLSGLIVAPRYEMPLRIRLTGPQTQETEPDENGRFEFTRLAPGPYSVSSDPGVEVVPARIIVGSKNTRTIDLVVLNKRHIRGRVVVDGGGPLPRAAFRAIPITAPALRTRDARLESDGTFGISLSDGEFRVEVLYVTVPYRVKSIQYGAVDLLQQTLKVTDASSEEIVVTLQSIPAVPWSRVSGRVTGADRLPSSAKAVLIGDPARLFIESPLDADGMFVFPRVPSGRYTLRTEPPVYGMADRTVFIDQDVFQLDLSVREQRTLTVRVTVEGGGRNPGFGFTLRQADGKGFQFTFPSPLRAPLVIGRTDFECISDVCSPAPAGRLLNEPIAAIIDSPPGTFTLKIPEGEYQFAINLRVGHQVKSVTFGSTNVMKELFKVVGGELPELTVTLTAD